MGYSAAIFAAIMAYMMVVGIIVIFVTVCQWMVYSKAGQPGWAVLIPVYNLIILLKMVGRPVSWIIWYLQIIPFYILFIVVTIASANSGDGISPMTPILGLLVFLSAIAIMVVHIIVTNGLSKSFGKDAGFTVGLIFLAPIFYAILAFGSAKYIGPGGVATVDAPKVENGNL